MPQLSRLLVGHPGLSKSDIWEDMFTPCFALKTTLALALAIPSIRRTRRRLILSAAEMLCDFG